MRRRPPTRRGRTTFARNGQAFAARLKLRNQIGAQVGFERKGLGKAILERHVDQGQQFQPFLEPALLMHHRPGRSHAAQQNDHQKTHHARGKPTPPLQRTEPGSRGERSGSIRGQVVLAAPIVVGVEQRGRFASLLSARVAFRCSTCGHAAHNVAGSRRHKLVAARRSGRFAAGNASQVIPAPIAGGTLFVSAPGSRGSNPIKPDQTRSVPWTTTHRTTPRQIGGFRTNTSGVKAPGGYGAVFPPDDPGCNSEHLHCPSEPARGHRRLFADSAPDRCRRADRLAVAVERR